MKRLAVLYTEVKDYCYDVFSWREKTENMVIAAQKEPP